ncbi:hypothetical protein J4734_24615 [Klebsiella pneumoniae]|uniref:Uncharacterized protein n=1 Tax=Klebsiella pneumoniae TaxID=573 RepID=A0A939NNJ2_KLEPN|nr:hypothetical protein [Klebsiella pneumoniae]
MDEVYIALPMVAQQRIRQFLNEFSGSGCLSGTRSLLV